MRSVGTPAPYVYRPCPHRAHTMPTEEPFRAVDGHRPPTTKPQVSYGIRVHRAGPGSTPRNLISLGRGFEPHPPHGVCLSAEPDYRLGDKIGDLVPAHPEGPGSRAAVSVAHGPV